MARKKVVEPTIAEIKKLLEEDKLVIGADRALKGLKLGKVKKIFVSSNCADDTRASIERYAEMSSVDVVDLKYPNDELGTICRKPFSISVLSVAK